jgi:hypothetical protein
MCFMKCTPAFEQRTIVIGHTHTQFDRRVDGYRVFNSGSVGAAWSEPGASWALLEDGDVQLRRTDYDVEAAIQALAPDQSNRETREQWLRGPHDQNAIAQQIEDARRK